MAAKAKTFLGDDREIVVDVLLPPSSTGLVKVAFGNRVLVRHVDRLEPLNEAAKQMLTKGG
jgi:hypothetical protein